MKGGRLTQFWPDYQSGDGFVKDCITTSAREGWKGLKTGKPLGLPYIAGGIAVPREEVNKPSNTRHCSGRTKTEWHLRKMDANFSRRVRRVAPIITDLSLGRRRRRSYHHVQNCLSTVGYGTLSQSDAKTTTMTDVLPHGSSSVATDVIWWKKGGTTNPCWSCSPNIRIIKISPWCTCVETCSNPVITPRASPGMATTS